MVRSSLCGHKIAGYLLLKKEKTQWWQKTLHLSMGILAMPCNQLLHLSQAWRVPSPNMSVPSKDLKGFSSSMFVVSHSCHFILTAHFRSLPCWRAQGLQLRWNFFDTGLYRWLQQWFPTFFERRHFFFYIRKIARHTTKQNCYKKRIHMSVSYFLPSNRRSFL